ncbi:esterase-like activity of phytase-domain-containing protein [Hyaloraphidium curvatum]|nr:esterase-like activity of phytase-domain-containing protein [Hyaloraphidium curvatum]
MQSTATPTPAPATTSTTHTLTLNSTSGTLTPTSTTVAIATATAQFVSFVNSITIPGDAADASGKPAGANGNRLGGFGSDIYYDRSTGVFYALADRGPGGGVISYETRFHHLSLAVDPATGAISNFAVAETVLLRDTDGTPFNGLNPLLLTGSVETLGRSLDPEGIVVSESGLLYISDEYGPSVLEFRPDGTLSRRFQVPANLVPKMANGTTNYVDGRAFITSGRQDNRGFEGLAISPDGTKLYGLLQDPLVIEGASNDGRRSRNLRMVEYDVASGEPQRQFIYQVEAIADINSRIPGTANDFGATAQGRNIGISAIISLGATEFLVLERDNRGLGVDDPIAANPVGSKRIFKIDIAGASDVSGTSLAGTNDLPLGTIPVSKTLFFDVLTELVNAGLTIPEKMEGITIGPRLADGSFLLLLATDNDFSVTQTGGGTQLDVCTNGTQVAIDSGCTLVPSFLYAFKVSLPGYVASQTTRTTLTRTTATVSSSFRISWNRLLRRSSFVRPRALQAPRPRLSFLRFASTKLNRAGALPATGSS